jgi:hypothetical protein
VTDRVNDGSDDWWTSYPKLPKTLEESFVLQSDSASTGVAVPHPQHEMRWIDGTMQMSGAGLSGVEWLRDLAASLTAKTTKESGQTSE